MTIFLKENFHSSSYDRESLVTSLLVFNFFNFSGLVPLHNACSFGHYEITELLVQYGADVNVSDHLKCTPLHVAAANGKCDIVKLLLKVGIFKGC